MVDPGAHRLAVAIEAPEAADPRGPLPVSVRVGGVAPGETAYVTLAAVDLGILNLTAFDSPNPSDYYFGQRKLGMGQRDVYGRLIDAAGGQAGRIRSGGDAAAELALKNPPRGDELVSYFSGPLVVGSDGLARTGFALPQFDGTVRLMAVAWSPTGVGQAERDVVVADPVVVSASLPRFLAPGDRSRLLVEITDAGGPAGHMGLQVAASGLTIDTSDLTRGLDLGEGQTVRLDLPVTAGEAGPASVEVRLTTPQGKVLTTTRHIEIEALDPPVVRTSRFDLAAGKTFTLDANVFDGLAPGTARASLGIGPLARLDAPGLLQALDSYPYGCTEQITSKALPLLYLDDVAVALGLEARDQVGKRVDEAIGEVLVNQSSSGGFGLWAPDSGDMWLDTYVTDFLGRARAKGYAVPDQAFRLAIDNLRNQVNYAPDFDSGGETVAYALLVLAREGAAAMGDLRYYADQKRDAFATPLAAAQLGAALAVYGDPTRADRMFARAAALLAADAKAKEAPVWRDDYGSHLRDAAGVLTLAVESGSKAVDTEALAAALAGPIAAQRLSTQEAAWSLLAANALVQKAAADAITINGQPVDGPLVRMVSGQTEDGRALAVRNGGDSETTLTLTTVGIPVAPESAGGTAFDIRRQYYTLQGQEVAPDAVKVGTRLVAVLTVTPFSGARARLMVDDPLPAGFEIDNPNLLRGGDIGALGWLDLAAEPRSTEFRSDRFLAAVDWESTSSFRLAYIVRAVSPGTYHHPAALVEDMYRPERRARTATGEVRIGE
jgi:uncharacterized protein YfaS (alpha-2-macroglobulin family)